MSPHRLTRLRSQQAGFAQAVRQDDEMFTILHLSDLHRSTDDPVSNPALIGALVADRERQRREHLPISEYDAIVVSGDLVHGVRLGAADFAPELRRQYQSAYDFLAELCDRFLGGDRRRVILIAGNHDVDWNTARGAMQEVPENELSADIRTLLDKPGSLFRWCWKSRKVFKIANQSDFSRRFEAYCECVQRFYQGVDLAFPFRPESYSNIFELDDGRIAVAAFNSCYGNDCFCDWGALPDEEIGAAYLHLADSEKIYDLRIAVWHHSIDGPPQKSDYMSIEFVREMIDRDFRLGLHGHQHKVQVTPQNIQTPDEAIMTVVSAGSLCAEPRDLPVGTHRQYNVIEIGDDYQSARIHVREAFAHRSFGPAMLLQLGGKSYIDVRWTPVTNVMGQALDVAELRANKAIEGAEKAYKAGYFRDALDLLIPHKGRLGNHGRRIMLDAAAACEAWDDVVRLFKPPGSVDELVALVKASGSLGRFDEADWLLETFGSRLGLDQPTSRELQQWLKARREINR